MYVGGVHLGPDVVIDAPFFVAPREELMSVVLLSVVALFSLRFLRE